MLEVQNVSVRFGGLQALDDVSIRVPSGQITGLIGPNGAGKTTLFDVITGFVKPDRGNVSCNGTQTTGMAPHHIVQAGICRTFQDVRLFEGLSVLDNLVVARMEGQDESIFGALAGWRHQARRRHLREEVYPLLETVGLADKALNPAADLSYGQKRLLSIARSVATRPAVLLLDEPASGVNEAITERVLILIKELAAQGKGVLLIEHNMSVIAETAGYIYVLDRGAVLASGQPEEIWRNEQVLASYLGGSEAAVRG